MGEDLFLSLDFLCRGDLSFGRDFLVGADLFLDADLLLDGDLLLDSDFLLVAVCRGDGDLFLEADPLLGGDLRPDVDLFPDTARLIEGDLFLDGDILLSAFLAFLPLDSRDKDFRFELECLDVDLLLDVVRFSFEKDLRFELVFFDGELLLEPDPFAVLLFLGDNVLVDFEGLTEGDFLLDLDEDFDGDRCDLTFSPLTFSDTLMCFPSFSFLANFSSSLLRLT